MTSEATIAKRIAALDAVAREVFGYANGPRDFQRRVTEANLRDRCVFGVAPTGNGKSFCFQSIALIRTGLTVVISPLVALMKDQVDKLKAWGVSAERLGGDMSSDDLSRVYRNMPELDLLYIAPERIKSAAFQEAIARCKVATIAVDEAHILSKWGREFRPSYTQLRPFIAQRPGVPLMVLTATADKQVEADLVAMLGLTDYERIIGSPDRPNLIYTAGSEMSIDQLANMVGSQLAQPGSVLVYAATRAEVESVYEQLSVRVPSFGYYHAGMDSALRTLNQERFIQGDLRGMAATKAFGMGVDKHDVRLVVHWQQPGSVFDYAQEAGRAGRDGLPSTCHLNISRKARNKQDYFIRMGNPPMWVYEKLWRIITSNGRDGAGKNVLVRKHFLEARMNLNKGLSGYSDAAMAFMEFTGHFDVMPGPLSYELPLRDLYKVRAFMQRYRGIKVQLNVVKVALQPDEEDPVPEMVRAGAVQSRPPDESMILKMRRNSLGLTDALLADKLARAEKAADQVEEFAAMPDKAAYLRTVFLEAGA